MKRFFLSSLLVVVVAFVTGCSSSGSYTVKQQLSDQLNSEKSVSLRVSADPGKAAEEDMQKIVPAVNESLFSKLSTSGMFKNVVVFPAKGEYTLDVVVKDAKIVSNGARLLLGVMAGPSWIETSNTLKDESGHVLTEFDVKGTSAAHPLSSEVGYEYAAKETAQNIINGLRK